MTKAEEMRRLAELATRLNATKARATRAKRVADLRAADEATKKWWMDHGIDTILDHVREKAMRGFEYHEEVLDDCPEYVVAAIQNEGFRVERVAAKRGVRTGHDGDWECYWVYVLVIRW
jgi:hypothetical protein